jgi:hypothetical protein
MRRLYRERCVPHLYQGRCWRHPHQGDVCAARIKSGHGSLAESLFKNLVVITILSFRLARPPRFAPDRA